MHWLVALSAMPPIAERANSVQKPAEQIVARMKVAPKSPAVLNRFCAWCCGPSHGEPNECKACVARVYARAAAITTAANTSIFSHQIVKRDNGWLKSSGSVRFWNSTPQD